MECNLDIFPYPDRDILSSYTHHHTLIYDMLASRGCNSNCTFCASHSFRKQPGPQVRIRTLPNIIDEIQFLVKNYHAKYIAFIDDTFGDLLGNNESYFRSFLHELDRRKINVQFQFNLRSENINENTVQIFKKMLYKGLDSIFIGFETGNDDDLKLYGKRANLQINMQTVKLLNQNSIRYRIGFIMFNPYSTLDRLKKNLAFLRLCQNIFTPNLMTSQLNLLNGTALLTKVRKENLLIYNQDDNSFDSEYPYYFVDPVSYTHLNYD